MLWELIVSVKCSINVSYYNLKFLHIQHSAPYFIHISFIINATSARGLHFSWVFICLLYIQLRTPACVQLCVNRCCVNRTRSNISCITRPPGGSLRCLRGSRHSHPLLTWELFPVCVSIAPFPVPPYNWWALWLDCEHGIGFILCLSNCTLWWLVFNKQENQPLHVPSKDTRSQKRWTRPHSCFPTSGDSILGQGWPYIPDARDSLSLYLSFWYNYQLFQWVPCHSHKCPW